LCALRHAILKLDRRSVVNLLALCPRLQFQQAGGGLV
jgi:hypothetical protein